MITLLDSDDSDRSPRLEAIPIRYAPQADSAERSRSVSESPESSTEETIKRKQRRVEPSQGDVVLLGYLAPQNPEFAREAGQRALPDISESELGHSIGTSEQSDDMQNTVAGPPFNNALPKPVEPTRSDYVSGELDKTTSVFSMGGLPRISPTPDANAGHELKRRAPCYQHDHYPFQRSRNASIETLPTHQNRHEEVANDIVRLKDRTPRSLNTSVTLQKYHIQPSQRSPNQTLPAINIASISRYRGPETLSTYEQQLPPVHEMLGRIEPHEHQPWEKHGRNRTPSYSSTSTMAGRSPASTAEGKYGAPAPSPSPYQQYAQRLPFGHKTESSQLDTPSSRRTSSSTPSFTFPSSQVAPFRKSGAPLHESTSSTESNNALSPGSTTEGYTDSNLGYPESAQPGMEFKCKDTGCTASPFSTQYLLNSHANVHSQKRPHFCPVRNCPRSEGGKGFKRKNEMIRHGLVHNSPGYVCPYCPDREHRYPRPDNLQRHVRMHHEDRDKEDPQLRDVLNQRLTGGSTKGRRRRTG